MKPVLAFNCIHCNWDFTASLPPKSKSFLFSLATNKKPNLVLPDTRPLIYSTSILIFKRGDKIKNNLKTFYHIKKLTPTELEGCFSKILWRPTWQFEVWRVYGVAGTKTKSRLVLRLVTNRLGFLNDCFKHGIRLMVPVLMFLPILIILWFN